MRTGALAVAFNLLLMPLAAGGAGLPGEATRGLGFEQLDRPLDERPLIPETSPDKPAPSITLPPLPEAPAVIQGLGARAGVYVKSFRVKGNTVLSAREVAEIAVPYVNRINTADDLEQLRYELTLRYVNSGYITSGVILPDQAVTDGVVTFQVVEGVLATIDVQGAQRLKPDYISKRIALGSGPPVNIVELQKQLQILNQDPLINSLQSRLTPGLRTGESTLLVDVEENSPYRVEVSANNYRPPSVGAEQAELYLSTANLNGWGDSLEFRYGLTEGLGSIAAAYYLPVTARNTLLGLRAQRSDTTVVEAPFDDLDIDSEVTEYAVSLKHPFYRTVNRTFSVTASLEYAKGETELLNQPFSFSPGVQEGVSEVSVVRLSADWLDRQENQVIAARSTFNQGIYAFGSTRNDNLPDSRFFSWLGQFQWVRRFGENGNQALFRADVQKTRESLLPTEQLVVGGHNTVRGYRENLMVRDSGWITSLEFRFPVLRDRINNTNIQFAVFGDFGKAWLEDFSTPDPDSIGSAGIGVRFDAWRRLYGQLYAAYPFENIDYNGSDDLQNTGIHFNLTWRIR